MSGPTLVMLSAATLLSLGAQQPNPEPGKGKTVNVEIIVGTLAAHEKACKGGGISPTTVLVAGKAVRHCVGGALLDHDVHEEKDPLAFQQTLVRLAAGDSIRWFSKTSKFRVVQVRRHTPIQRGAPSYPFLEEMPAQFSNEVTTGAVLNLAYDVVQQYKVSFEINRRGNRVDPDVVCSF